MYIPRVAAALIPILLVLIISTPVAAQDDDLRVATWNMEWFFDYDTTDDTSQEGPNQAAPSAREYEERLETFVEAIATLDPDVLALEEVENRQVVQDLADGLLLDYDRAYDVAFVQGRDTFTGQDVAFLVQEGLLVPDSAARFDYTDFAGDDDFKDLSKHLKVDVQRDGETYTLVALHLVTDDADRLLQAHTLRAWIAESVPTENLIVLGDFNARQRFNQTTPDSEMGIIRGFQTSTTADDLFDVHQMLGARATHVSGAELDRILISPSLVDRLDAVETHRELAIRGREDTMRGVDYDLPVTEQDLSDHFPLVVNLSSTTAAEPETPTEPAAPPPSDTPNEPDEPAAQSEVSRAQLLAALQDIEAELERLTAELEQIKAMIQALEE